MSTISAPTVSPHNQHTLDFYGQAYRYHYICGRDLIEEWLDDFYFQEVPASNKHNLLSFDIETYPRDVFSHRKDAALRPVTSKIRTLQFWCGPGSPIYVLDFLDVSPRGKKTYLLADKDLFTKVYGLLTDEPGFRLVAHNALFETSHIQRIANIHGYVCPLNICCTQILFRLIMCANSPDPKSVRTSLQSLAHVVLGLQLPKDIDHTLWAFPDLSKQAVEYCVRDAIVPYLLYEALHDRLIKDGLAESYKLNCEAQEPIAHMQIHGIRIDHEKHRDLVIGWGKEKEEYGDICDYIVNEKKVSKLTENKYKEIIIGKVVNAAKADVLANANFTKDWAEVNVGDLRRKEEFFNLAADKINPDSLSNKRYKRAYTRAATNINEYLVAIDSGKQLSEWLKGNLPAEVVRDWPKTDKTEELKTDVEVLEEFDNLEIVRPLLHYKKYAKLHSTYGIGLKKFFVELDEDEVRLYPNLTLAYTDTGRLSSFQPALQTWPRDSELREIILPSDDYHKIICADYSQIELRIAALISEDTVMLDAYERGFDLHAATAAAMANKRVEDVTKAERHYAKNCFSGDTEILTESGWVSFEKYNGKDKVAQYQTPIGVPINNTYAPQGRFSHGYKFPKYNGQGEISFVTPLAFKRFAKRKLYRISDRNVDILCTDDHEILYSDPHKNLYKTPFCDLPNNLSHAKIIAAGYSNQKHEHTLTEDETRFLAMVVADGSFVEGGQYLRFGFSKRFKYRRCEDFLKKFKLQYIVRNYQPKSKGVNNKRHPEQKHFVVYCPGFIQKLLKYTTAKKSLYWRCLKDIPGWVYLEEAQYWDSHVIPGKKRTRVLFSSTNTQTLNVMQAMCVLNGVPSNLYTTKKRIKKHHKPVHCLSYCFSEGSDWITDFKAIKKRAYKQNAVVYCVQVPTGNIVIRRNGKVCIQGNCNFALIYGAGADTLTRYVKKNYGRVLSPEEAFRIVETFRSAYPEYRQWQKDISREGELYLTAITPLGKRRALQEDFTYTTSMNTPIQGGAAEVMLKALILIWEYIIDNPQYAIKLLLSVHDEVIVSAPAKHAEKIKKVVEEKMIAAFFWVFPSAIRMTNIVEARIGNNWAEAK